MEEELNGIDEEEDGEKKPKALIRYDKRYRIREYRPGHWQVRFQHEGKRVCIQKWEDGTPLTSESMAWVLKQHLIREGYDARRYNKDREFKFDVAIKTWISLSICSEEWLAERKRYAEKFLIPYFGKQDIREIKTIHVNGFEKFLRGKGLGLSYLRNIRNELKTFLRFNKDSIPKLPEFRTIQVQPPPIRYLTPEQQSKVFEKIPKKHIPIFTLLMLYPIRPNEACGLTWGSVFMDAEIPYFVIQSVVTDKGNFKNFTKTKKPREYPIIPGFEWIFQRNGNGFIFTRANDKPYVTPALYGIWERANKKTEVPRVSLYQGVKHSHGWDLIEQGYSLEDVSLLMGHSSSTMTRRYAGQSLRRKLEILSGVSKALPWGEKPKLLESKTNFQNTACASHPGARSEEFEAGWGP